MKTRKILFSLSALGMTLYALWTIIWHMPFHQTLWMEEIWITYPMNVLYWASYQELLFGSILFALLAFYIKVETPQPITTNTL